MPAGCCCHRAANSCAARFRAAPPYEVRDALGIGLCRVAVGSQFAAVQQRLRAAEPCNQCLRAEGTATSLYEQNAALELRAVVAQPLAGIKWIRHHYLPNKAASWRRGTEYRLNVIDLLASVARRLDVPAHLTADFVPKWEGITPSESRLLSKLPRRIVAPHVPGTSGVNARTSPCFETCGEYRP